MGDLSEVKDAGSAVQAIDMGRSRTCARGRTGGVDLKGSHSPFQVGAGKKMRE